MTYLMILCLRFLLVSRIKNHLSSFKLGFLNIFSPENLLRRLSLVLFLLQRYKYGAKKCPENHVRFDFSQSENRKTIEQPLKELPWNQQFLIPEQHLITKLIAERVMPA